MLFFHQRLGRNVFEHHPVLFQTLAFFVWIQPIARSAQRETALVHARDEHCTKLQPTHIGRFQDPHAITIARGNRKDLRFQTALQLINERSETDACQKPDREGGLLYQRRPADARASGTALDTTSCAKSKLRTVAASARRKASMPRMFSITCGTSVARSRRVN